MKLEIRLRGIAASEVLRKHVERRLRFQLSRFEGEVDWITVRIEDVNGPKGGLDQRCQVAVRGPRLNPIQIEQLSSEPYTAIDAALQRTARALVRELGRLRVMRPLGASKRSSAVGSPQLSNPVWRGYSQSEGG